MYRCSASSSSANEANLIALAKARTAACLPTLCGQPSYQSANPSGSRPPVGGLWGDSFLGEGEGEGEGLPLSGSSACSWRIAELSPDHRLAAVFCPPSCRASVLAFAFSNSASTRLCLQPSGVIWKKTATTGRAAFHRLGPSLVITAN